MKISRIEKVKSGKDEFKIFFKDGGSLKVLADTVVKFGIEMGIDISEDVYKKIVSCDRLKRTVCEALALVSRRAYSAKNLQLKLIRKGCDPQNASKAVKRLEELNYVNDEKYAQTYASYLSQRGKGRFMIKAELQKQGIEKNLIDEVLKAVETDVEPHERIVKILKTKFTDFNVKDKNETRRVAAFFLRRGFSSENIAKAFRIYSE
jgi:regulatory protein